MKEYPEYKETPAIWIDKIPSSWKSKKVRELYTERREKVSDKDYEPLSVCKAGIVPQLEDAVKTDNGDNRRLVKKGDFVINSRSDRKGSSGVSQYDGSVSLICITLKPITNENKFFMHYLLRSVPFTEEYYRNGHGLVADLWTTRYDEMQNIFLPIPPISEQNAIVKYLDYKTKQIDEFVSAKEKEIESLQELKKSLVADAVTKGISGEELVDSGIEWLPKVPKGWKSARCKFLFREINNRAETESYIHLSMSQKLGLIPDSDLFGKHLLSESYEGAKICDKDDLVLNRLKAHLNVFALAPCEGVVSPDYTVLKVNKRLIYPKYAEYILRNPVLKRELVIRVKGIVEGFWRLYTNDFYTIVLPLPPMNAQKKIVEYLNDKISNIDILISNAEKQITLVKELRTKLIADVVTGKIDVREAI